MHETFYLQMLIALNSHAGFIQHVHCLLPMGKVERKCAINFQKDDGYNCCPIACLVLGSIFEPEIVNISAISPNNYRSFVVETMFKEVVDRFNAELILPAK